MTNKRLLVYFGFMLIILGLFGFLYTLKGGSVVSIGYAVISNLEFKDQKTETKKDITYSYYSNNNFELEVLDIGRIISSPGNKKTISLNIKNTGKIFLNGCKMLSEGETSSWIYPDQTEGIASGQKVNFIFDINVPDKISPGEYFIKLKIVCDEGEVELKNFELYIAEGLKLIKIEKMKYENNGLNISYIFDKEDFIGDEMIVKIWVNDDSETKVNETYDIFSINNEGILKREIFISFPISDERNYNVYFALNSDLNNFLRESIRIDNPSITGNVVLNQGGEKIIGYVLFLFIIFTGILFIIRNHSEEEIGEKT